jgi:hypothetical protein
MLFKEIIILYSEEDNVEYTPVAMERPQLTRDITQQ